MTVLNWPLAIVWVSVAILAFFVFRREGRPGLKAAGQNALGIGKTLMIRLPLALLAASFLVQIVPVETMSKLIGPQSGFGGIVLASLLGGILPGGPMTSFPIAIVFQQSGAGLPQMVALICGWSIFAMHRILSWEAPIMGWRFVALRLATSVTLPVLAAYAAAAIVAIFDA